MTTETIGFDEGEDVFLWEEAEINPVLVEKVQDQDSDTLAKIKEIINWFG